MHFYCRDLRLFSTLRQLGSIKHIYTPSAPGLAQAAAIDQQIPLARAALVFTNFIAKAKHTEKSRPVLCPFMPIVFVQSPHQSRTLSARLSSGKLILEKCL